MRNGIAGIDHVIIGVRDLERARMGWTRLGFALTPRGRHLGQETANYCIMFARDYLELLGFVARDDYAHRLETFLRHREGAMSVAFRPAGSAEDAAAALSALGLHPSQPRALGRQLELPEGTVVPRFSLLTLPPEETPGLDCFLCGHLTPERLRRAARPPVRRARYRRAAALLLWRLCRSGRRGALLSRFRLLWLFGLAVRSFLSLRHGASPVWMWWLTWSLRWCLPYNPSTPP